MSEFIGSVLGLFIMFLYAFGLYSIVVDDHRYTTKDVFIGTIFFPYPIWVGGKEV